MKQKLLFKYYQLLAKLAKKYIQKHKPFVIGIHGSVGKTSCRLIIAQTLKHFLPNKSIYTSPQNFNGELGMSLSIFQIEKSIPNIFYFLKNLFIAIQKTFFGKKSYDILLLEYGIDRPGEMDFLLGIVQPHIGICTKLDAVHSMQFGSPEAIAKEEVQLLRKTLETVFLNEEESYAIDTRKDIEIDSFSYQTEKKKSSANLQITEKSVSRDQSKIQSHIEINSNGKSFKLKTNLLGYIHYGYIATAVTIADILHYKYYQEELANSSTIYLDYRLMAGRFEIFEGLNESILIDSSYNSSPLSARKLLDMTRNLKNKLFSNYEIWTVLGEMRELGDETEKEHISLAKFVAEKNPQKLFLVGSDMKKHFLPALIETGYDQKNVFHDFNAVHIGQKIKSMIEHTDKKILLLVKGSQNTIFLEETIKILLANTSDYKKLCRQSDDRIKTKSIYLQTKVKSQRR